MTDPTSRVLHQALTELSEEMPTARLRGDLWSEGSRRHRRRVATAVAASLLAVTLAVPLASATLAGSPQPPADSGPDGAVPARVYDPWPWQGTVQQAPTGRAALLVSGGGSGLGTVDWPGAYGSKIAVIGRDGSYRMLRYGRMYQQVGQDILLSPDGRYVAGDATLEDLFALRLDAKEVTVVDLATGEVRRYRGLPAGQPIAWSPDGTRLLLWQPKIDAGDVERGGVLWLLDLSNGRTLRLFDLQDAAVHWATFVAFAPNGRHLAVQVDQRLVIVDTADGTSRTLTDLGPTGRLAGAGAWSPDGASIAVYSFDGCADLCTDAQRNQRRWRFGRLDATTGAPLPDGGFATVTAAAARIVAWQRDGDAVVVRYLVDEYGSEAVPEEETGEPTSYREVQNAELLALHPGGGSTRLIETPKGQIWDLDVAQDLLVEDRFGGTSPEPAAFPAAPWLYVTITVATILVVIPTLLILWAARHRRRRRREN